MSRMDSALQRGRSFEGLKPLRVNGVYDKLALLVAMTAGVGLFSYQAVGENVSIGKYLIPTMVVALGAMLIGQFRPAYAKVAAPVYAVAEGVILGVVSKAYSTLGGGLVPTALAATAMLFVACLLVFRTGVVKVTPRFVQMVSIAGVALFGMYLLALFGLRVPGINEIGPRGLIFGVIGLGIGISYLFIDFDRIQKAEEAEMLHDTAEWFLAFQLLLSLVMVYVNVLRVLASSQRR
jgi:uncharacterized YccA/Bax inhibitor family protein